MENGSAHRYFQFEILVKKIFEQYDFEVSIEENLTRPYDLIARKNNDTYLYIEVKTFKTRTIPNSLIYNSALHLNELSENMQPVLVISGFLSKQARDSIRLLNRVVVIDVSNLLYLVDNNPELKNSLLSLLEFSVNDIIPEKPDKLFANVEHYITNESVTLNPLIEKLKHWNSTDDQEYEKFCISILKYLFADELALWKEQRKSNDDLYRFDLICKIKEDVKSGLWTLLENFFNTKYVIFEFKNYTDLITQKEIYITEKYLYKKALRGVAIIISCKGTSKNANAAIRGILRENGKLIISIDNNDLIAMLNMKEKNDIPSEHLYNLLDDMLIDLEK